MLYEVKIDGSIRIESEDGDDVVHNRVLDAIYDAMATVRAEFTGITTIGPFEA